MTATENAETTPTPKQRFEALCAAMQDQFGAANSFGPASVPLQNVISSDDLLPKDYGLLLEIFSTEIYNRLQSPLTNNLPNTGSNNTALPGQIYVINPVVNVLGIGDQLRHYATQEPYISALEAVFKPEEIKQLAEQVRNKFLEDNKSAVLAAKVSKILPSLEVESVTHEHWEGYKKITTREDDITIKCAPPLVPFFVQGLRETIKAMTQLNDGASEIRAKLQEDHLKYDLQTGQVMLSPKLAEYLADNQELFTQKLKEVSAAALSGGRKRDG